MTTITTLSSGSQGNSYIIDCDNEVLLLEIGIPFERIIKGLHYNLEKCVGALCSHIHSDHLNKNALKELTKRGISIYSNKEVCSEHKNVKCMDSKKKYRIGSFVVMPFDLFHNAKCFGFLIECRDNTRILFATDTNKIPYKFKNINCFLVEANYSYELIAINATKDNYSMSASENHMEINDTIDFLKANYSTSLNEVVLIHLSNNNSNEMDFIRKTKQALSLDRVFVANEGLVVQLNKDVF